MAFAQGSFINEANATPEEVARKRAMIAALMPRFGNAKYIGEGIGQAATGYMIGRQNKKLDAAESAGRQSASEMFNNLFSGGGGFATKGYSGGGSPSGTWTPDAPAPKPTEAHMGKPDVASGGLSFGLPNATPEGNGGLGFGSAVMTPQEMIIAGAEKHGLNPIDVATAISYETGGKFDPMISGPTTQWGTHRGLIQFGEPQAAEHGVDFSSPDAAWRSQLDPNSGAVWDYLKGAGVQPGMGLPEVYSAINAGSVGRMNASDANNGGAPGTVADKVAGMAPHREKAAAFLGGTWTADPNAPQGDQITASAQNAPQGGIPMQDLLAAMANPWLAPEQRAVLSTMYEQQVQAADPLRQLELKKAELELAQMESPQAPEDFTTRMFTLNSLGIDPQSEEGKVYLMTGNLPEAPKATPTPMTPEQRAMWGIPETDTTPYFLNEKGEPEKVGGGGVTVTNNMPGEGSGQYLYGTDAGVPAGWRVDTVTGQASPIPGGPADVEQQQLAEKGDTKDTQGKLKLGTTLESINLNLAEIENGGLPVAGIGGDMRRTWLGRLFTGDSAMDFGNRTNQITDQAALAEVQNMRDNSPTGGAVGSLTDDERRAIGNSVTALNNSTSPEEYARAAKAYRQLALDYAYGEGMWHMDETGAVVAGPAPAGATGASDADGWTTLPSGVKVRVKQ